VRTVSFQRQSANKKFSRIEKVPYDHPRFTTRPIPRAPYCSATYASIAATCSEDCPFKRAKDGTPGGCFIDAEHFTRKLVAELDAGAVGKKAVDVAREEAGEIDRVWPRGIPQDGARGGRDLRLHVGGDVFDERSARILSGAAARWIGRGGGRVWTYTHSWRRIPAQAFWPISVLASVEQPSQIAAARRRGYVPSLVVDRFPDGKRPFSFGGTTFIPCPAETLGKTCVECRLCLDADLRGNNQGIAFQVHGADGAAARAALVPLRTRRAA
jgi:hypothetical protein